MKDRPKNLSIHCRLGKEEDVEACRTVEVRAGQLFSSVGYQDIAKADPVPKESLRTAAREERLLVLETPTEQSSVIGFLLFSMREGWLFVEEIDIDPRHQRQRLGQKLLEEAAKICRSMNLKGLALITFQYIPWNAPYYRRLGFVERDPLLIPASIHAQLYRDRKTFAQPRCALFRTSS